MGLEEVKKGLEKELKDKVALVLKEGETERDDLMATAGEEIKKYETKALEDNESLLRSLERREIASANLSAKKKILSAKKELIDEVFDEVKKNLASLPDAKRKKTIQSLIKQAEKQIKVKYVYCSNKDKGLIKGFKVQTSDTSGGVICESEDKSQRIDLTFDTILQELRENQIKEIATKLFG